MRLASLEYLFVCFYASGVGCPPRYEVDGGPFFIFIFNNMVHLNELFVKIFRPPLLEFLFEIFLIKYVF